MQQATFTITGAEFNLELIEKIKGLFNGNGEVEIQITIRPKKRAFLRKETREEYFARLDQSIKETRDANNLIEFENVDTLESFALNLYTKYNPITS